MKQTKELIEHGINNWSSDSIRLILTPEQTAKSIYFYTQEVGYFKTSWPYYCERQNLDSFLILYTISGHGILEYGDNTYTLEKNSCFFINCNRHHMYRALPKEQWEFLWIHFNAANALGYYEKFTENGFQTVSFRGDFPVEQILWRIIALQQKKDITSNPITSLLITQILTELILLTATNQADTFLVPEYIREITRLIERNFYAPITLQYLEEAVHRNRYHISHEFKKYMGIPVNEYLISTRISHAKELLKYSDTSISDIAVSVGIHNVSHFINLFRNREGLTPLAYRKLWTQ